MEEQTPKRVLIGVDWGFGSSHAVVCLATMADGIITIGPVYSNAEASNVLDRIPPPEPPQVFRAEPDPDTKKKSWRRTQRELPKFLR